MDDNNDQKEVLPPRRTSMPVFVWLLVFGIIATLFIFKSQLLKRHDSWSQTEFELHLRHGDILSARLTFETDRVMLVEGEYHLLPHGDKKKADDKKSTDKKADKKVDDKKKDDKEKVAKVDKDEKKYFTSRIYYSEALEKEMREKIPKLVVEPKDTWWKSLILTVLPILLIVGLLYFLFTRQIKMAGKGAMQFGKSKARMIMPDEQKITFDDIAGADEAKEETKEIIDYLKDPIKFKLLGGKIPKGALLMGPPGTGKTLLAKAVAGEADVPFFSISGSDFVEMFVGVGASRVRDMFEQARRHYPCLIFIDEIDAVGRSRFTGIGGGHDEREQTLNALLVEMDGLETQEGVIIIASTNRPDVLDPALVRPGRFDRQIAIDLPDIKGRRQILDVHIKKIKAGDDVNLDVIAKGTPGFSGADLANLINEAALLAARKDQEVVKMEDMEEARDKVRWGRERRSRRISDKERKITAFHEAGHTIVSMKCPNSMPLHKVTIIPRGQAYLGATMNLPDEDRYTQSKSEFIDQIRVYMGGRVAEEIIFKDVTSGASSDIQQATRIARMMVCAFGMNEKLGVMQYGERSEHIYLGRDITKSEDYSEETAREIDIEVKKILTDAKSFTERLLTENRDKLEQLANELLEKETLDAKQIEELLGFKDERPADYTASDSSDTAVSPESSGDPGEDAYNNF